jgi:hypothetical protein
MVSEFSVPHGRSCGRDTPENGIAPLKALYKALGTENGASGN